MNKKFNKIFAIIMCFIVILSSTCSNNKEGNDKKENEKSKNTEQENKKTKVIKNHTNKEIVIPKHTITFANIAQPGRHGRSEDDTI